MSVSVGDIYVSMGVDMSSFTQELTKAEQIASGSTTKIKDRFNSVASSLADLRTQAKAVKEALATTADFRVRGDEALEKLHGQLAKVREAGTATDATLDKLSLAFEENSRGARTYVQALDKIATDRSAPEAVRQLAKALSDEAREANYDVAALEKRSRALDSMIAKQSRTFSALRKQLEPKPAQAPGAEGGHGAVPAQAAASAAARALEGTVSIRAAERFLSGTLGLGNILQAAFPIIGGLATLDLLSGFVDRAEQLYEAFKRLQETPSRINREFGELNQTLQIGNDQLRVSNDRLENEIAKLEGKPQNGLKLALDEATLAADNLAQALGHDIDQLQNLLKEEQIGLFKGFFPGQAPTTEITKANKKLQEDLVQIDVETAEKSRHVTDAAARASIAEAGTAQRRARIEQEITAAEAALAAAQKRQSIRNAPAQAGVVGGMALSTGPTTTPQSSAAEIAILQRRLDTLLQIEQRFPLSQQNQALTRRKESLEAAAAAREITSPFQNKMNELAAQIEAARSSLDAIGKTDTAEVLAKSWGKAQEEITRLNNELAKHHQSLTIEQQVALLAEQDTLALTQAEVEWKSKLDQTTDSITNRIAALRLMTDAIGKGAAATRQAAIESQLAQTLGTKYQDEEFMQTHDADVKALRAKIAGEYDAQRAEQSAQNVQKLTEQIDLEKSLAAVQRQGAEAVRAVTLAYRLRQLTAQGATTAEIRAEIDLFNAQKATQSATNIANLDQQIDATRRLAAAQVQGAEEYRQAQLEIKYEQMQRQGASPEEIQKTRTLDTLQHQQQITEEGLRTAMSYRNQLQAIDEQIGAVEQLRAQWGDTQDIEISLKALEQERNRILTEQTLAVGSARQGMEAFFRDMASHSVSSAQMVYDAFASAFNGINDQLSRLMTGQKASWASFLQSLGAQLSRVGLMGIEQQIAAKITGRIGQNQQAGGSTNPLNHPAVEHGGFSGVLGALFGGGTAKRDGNTPATALFVTLAGANGLPVWDVNTGASGGPVTVPILAPPVSKGPEQPKEKPQPAWMKTLYNGYVKLPSIASQIGHAALNLGIGLATKGLQSIGSGDGGGSDSESSSSSSNGSDGSDWGQEYPVDPSGLIIRGGAYAKGGRPPVGKISMVGEKGPELFVPDRPGTIIPNHKLTSIMGKPFGGFRAAGGSVDPSRAYMVGDKGPEAFASISSPGHNGASLQPHQTVYYSIDARGTDPVLTEQRTRAAIVAAHQSAVVTSSQVATERQQRVPRNAR